MLDVFDEMLHEEQVEGWRELEEVSLFFFAISK